MPFYLQISMLCGGPSAVKLVSLLVNVGFSVHLCACAYWRVKVLRNHFCLMCSVHVTWDPSGNVDLGPDITISLKYSLEYGNIRMRDLKLDTTLSFVAARSEQVM